MRFPWPLTALALLSIRLGGCAQAPSAHPSSPESAAREPASLAEAEQQIDAALREIGIAPRSKQKTVAPGAAPALETDKATRDESEAKKETAPPPAPAPAQPAPPEPAPAPAPQTFGVKKSAPRAAEQEERPEPPCRRACRAYTSLQRAVEAVCRLAGDPSDKCAAARERQSEAEARILACACGK